MLARLSIALGALASSTGIILFIYGIFTVTAGWLLGMVIFVLGLPLIWIGQSNLKTPTNSRINPGSLQTLFAIAACIVIFIFWMLSGISF